MEKKNPNGNSQSSQPEEQPFKKRRIVVDDLKPSAKKKAPPTVPTRRTLVCFGTNDFGSLGLPDMTGTYGFHLPHEVEGIRQLADVASVTATSCSTVCLTTDGRIFTMGSDERGILGRPLRGIYPEGDEDRDEREAATLLEVTGFRTRDGRDEDGEIIAISGGEAHTLALSNQGNVYIFGHHRDCMNQQFSYNDQDDPFGFDATPVHIYLGRAAIKVHSGGNFCMATLADGSIESWGKFQLTALSVDQASSHLTSFLLI
jgi:alpha-tubulin suppressor-like RCC1 family protein